MDDNNNNNSFETSYAKITHSAQITPSTAVTETPTTSGKDTRVVLMDLQ